MSRPFTENMVTELCLEDLNDNCTIEARVAKCGCVLAGLCNLFPRPNQKNITNTDLMPNRRHLDFRRC